MESDTIRLIELLTQNKINVAWIIVGPESSGSKFIAKTLGSIYGIPEKWNGSQFISKNNLLIYHRSCPFNRPKNHSQVIIDEIKLIQKYSCQLNVIFTTRDTNISSSRKLARFGYEKPESLAIDQDEVKILFEFIGNSGLKFFIWNYETMILIGDKYFDLMYDFFNVSSRLHPEIIDRNKKFLINDAFNNDEYSNISLIYNINLYRHSGSKNICQDQMRVVESLRKAINVSINRKIKVVVSVSEKDFRYFRNLLTRQHSHFSVRLLGKDSLKLKKPYLKDILDPDYCGDLFTEQLKSNTSFCIYANADICIPNYFFELVFQQLNFYYRSGNKMAKSASRNKRKAPDCFIFNRRDIVDEKIIWHPGSDLFLFPTHWLKNMSFGYVQIGLPPVAIVLYLNCLYFSKKTVQISELFTTSHYGDEEVWRKDQFINEIDLNIKSAKKAFLNLINHDVNNLSKYDLEKHSILPKKRIEYFIKEFTTEINHSKQNL